jgi:rod shape determining protein RodA
LKRKQSDFDWVIFTLYGALVVWGWATIFAVSSATGDVSAFDPSYIHGRQLIWIGVSLLIGIVFLSLDHRFLEATSFVAYGGAIALLVITLLVGREVNGAKSWLMIAGQPFQPSEFAKVATAMALAKYMSRLSFSMSKLHELAGAAAIVLVPSLIVILQNDTGSALVFGSLILVFYREGLNPLTLIFVAILGAVAVLTLWLKTPWIIIGVLAALGVVSFFILFNRRQWVRILVLHVVFLGFFGGVALSVDALFNKLQPHQQNRILVWFDPMIDPQGAGYNVIQSKIAIGSGGVSGKGFLDGNYTKYKFVPKQETDFIYCTVGEELGWLGSSAVLLLFLALMWRVQFLAENAKTRYARIYGNSVMSVLFFHILVNIGMTIGLVPVIGIPLPFFSYGGSSLLAFTIMIFILINLYSYRGSVLGTKA